MNENKNEKKNKINLSLLFVILTEIKSKISQNYIDSSNF